MSAVELPRNYNAASHFVYRHLAEGRGGHTAFIDERGSHSYSDLAKRVSQAGNLLREQGVQQEQRVMLALLDGIDFPAFFFGAIMIGAVPVPINTMLTTADYDFMLRDSRARVLVVSASLVDRFRPILGDQPFLKSVLISGRVPPNMPVLDDLLAKASDTLEAAPTTRDDIAFWLYSSGSTGQPKGAMHLQSDLVNTAVLYGEKVLGIKQSDVVFSAAKLFFAYGLGNAMTFPLHVGATAVLMPDRPTPESVGGMIARHKPTIFFGVPTLYGAMLSDAKFSVGEARLRLCVSAGEALPEDILRRWQEKFNVPIVDGIGSTEMLHIFVSNRPDDVKPGSSGKPVPGYLARIIGEDGSELGAGEVGELVVNGPSSAVGYWNNRAKSVATFEGAWTRTGDKYTRDNEGYYFYAGRSDDMLKVGGIWVSPFEVESALLAHPSVLEVAVVGQTDGDELVKPKAFVVLRPGEAAGPERVKELQAFVKERLAPYKYPRWVEFVESLPKTATGKIQRFKLRSA